MDQITQRIFFTNSSQTPTGYWITELQSTTSTISSSAAAFSTYNEIYACGTNNSKPWVCKFSTNGSIQYGDFGYNMTCQTPGLGEFYAITFDPRQFYNRMFVCGYANEGSPARKRPSIIEPILNVGSINTQFYVDFTAFSNVVATSVLVDAYSGGSTYPIIGGYATSSTGVTRAFILKRNDTIAGGIVWSRVFTIAGASTKIEDMAIDPSGNIYALASNEVGTIRSFVVKLNISGNLQWLSAIGARGSEEFSKIAVDSTGRAHLSGKTSAVRSGFTDMLIIKMNQDGAGFNQWCIGTNDGNNAGNGVAVNSLGESVHVGSFNGKIFISRYSSSFNLVWRRYLTKSGESISASDISIGTNGDICVTGNTASGNAIVCKLRGDGSNTGTFGPYTYESASTLSPTPSIVLGFDTQSLESASATVASTSYSSSSGLISQTTPTIL